MIPTVSSIQSISTCSSSIPSSEEMNMPSTSAQYHNVQKQNTPTSTAAEQVLQNETPDYNIIHRKEIMTVVQYQDGTKKRRCNKCSREFNTHYDCKRHYEICGTKSKVLDTDVHCTKCDRSFRNLYIAKEHFARTHTEIPRYYCKECPFTCYWSSGLNKHRRKCPKTGNPTPYQKDVELEEFTQQILRQQGKVKE